MTVEWTKGAYQDFDEILAYLVGTFGMNPFNSKLSTNSKL